MDNPQKNSSVIYGWLVFSVSTLVFAGIFALVIALARTPYIEDILPGKNYAYIALVGHVTLAVVIWFLAFEGFFYIFSAATEAADADPCAGTRGNPDPYFVWVPRAWVWRVGVPRNAALGWFSLSAAVLGAALIIISVFFGLGEPELSNYVPVLRHPFFYAGLASFFAGVVLNLINSSLTLLGGVREKRHIQVETFGMTVAGVGIFIAMTLFAISLCTQYYSPEGIMDFERLFWGGGHILQFANTIAMVCAWLYIMRLTSDITFDGRICSALKALFSSYLVFILPSPLMHLFYDAQSYEYSAMFTSLMRWGIGPITGVFIILILAALIKRGNMAWKRPGFVSMVLSIAMFLAGGLIGMNIKGVNTVIPAHYHLAIGAVTIAFMGLFYEILPFFKREVYSPRMALVQPYLYAAGVFLFAIGLYIAGVLGVGRKVYGPGQNLDSLGKYIGMGIMGIGGIVAILGGIYFVLNALISLLGKPSEKSA